MMTDDRPIGVIDSGIGGYSVALKVQQLLPHEDLLYLGDGANTPYGNHSAQEILTMTRHMLCLMAEHRVKSLLVACNTISCLIDDYRHEMNCPVFSVVQAGADAVARQPYERVGVISTCFTAASGCYPRLIGEAAPGCQVISHGCPDLAGLVEKHVGDPAAIPLIDRDLEANLKPLVELERIQCCVLGCTHYPLVADRIRRLYPRLPLIDPAEQMALELKRYLTENGLLARKCEPGRLDIFTTGSLEEYIRKANQVGLKHIRSVQFYPPLHMKNEPAI